MTVPVQRTHLRSEMSPELAWGRRYLMCPPTHFGVSYAINPWMRADDQPDLGLARAQFDELVATLERAGARVDVIAPVDGLPDLVYTMNLGITDGDRVAVSRFRYEERRPEAVHAERWFVEQGFTPVTVDAPDTERFEPGDGFLHNGTLVYGHGFRSDPAAWEAVGRAFGVRTQGLRLVNPLMYHLDIAFCPLDDDSAMIVPDAFDADGLAALHKLVASPLVLSMDEAMTFCANSVVVGRTVVMPACPPTVARALEARGFDVVLVDVSEFLKGGGAIRCMTNPLDLSLATARAATPA